MVFSTIAKEMIYVCAICYKKYPILGQAEECEAFGRPEFKFEEGQKVKFANMIFAEKEGRTEIRSEEIKAKVIKRMLGHRHSPRYLIKLESGETVHAGESFLASA